MAGGGNGAVHRPVSAIVLAGGHSRRLGSDKAFLPVDGQPLVARTVRKLAALTDDVIVVTNTPDPYQALDLPARLVPDQQPGVGALMGLYSGLDAARQPYAIVVACDMPFLEPALLRYMVLMAPGHDVVIPRLGTLLEPLHAVYGRSCLPLIAQALTEGERRVLAFFNQARMRYVEEQEIDLFDPRHLSFVNVNTMEDWERVKRIIAGSR